MFFICILFTINCGNKKSTNFPNNICFHLVSNLIIQKWKSYVEGFSTFHHDGPRGHAHQCQIVSTKTIFIIWRNGVPLIKNQIIVMLWKCKPIEHSQSNLNCPLYLQSPCTIICNLFFITFIFQQGSVFQSTFVYIFLFTFQNKTLLSSLNKQTCCDSVVMSDSSELFFESVELVHKFAEWFNRALELINDSFERVLSWRLTTI